MAAPTHVTRYYHYPSYKVYHFVARKEPLSQIQQHYQSLHDAMTTKVMVLLGMGGCGKTQLALEYCAQSQHDGRFCAIFWVDASLPATVAQSFTFIAETLPEVKADLANTDANIRTVLDFFNNWTMPWLLVFDNHDDPEAFNPKPIKEYFPQSTKGFILVTSRHAESERLGETVRIDEMSEDEALELLFHRSKADRHETNTAEGHKIIKRLGYLALAIDQAGAYVSKRHLDLHQFMEHFKNRQEQVLTETPKIWEYRKKINKTEAEQSLNVCTTWELSFEQIEGDLETQKYKWYFLTLAAFFNNINISEALFRTYQESETQPWMTPFLSDGVWDNYKYSDIIAELQDLSLIQKVDTGGPITSISLHPLVQDWTKIRLSAEDRPKYATEVMLILSSCLTTAPDFNIMALQDRQTILSHLDTALEKGSDPPSLERQLFKPSLIVALIRFGEFFHFQGRWGKAERMFEQARIAQEEHLGPDHLDTLSTVSKLAIVFRFQGKHRKAKIMSQRAVTGLEKQLGPEHPLTLRAVHGLVTVCYSQKQYSEAKALFQRALTGWEEQLGPEHSQTLQAVHGLATVYYKQKQYNETKALFQRALTGWEKQLGPEHCDTLRAVHGLATVCYDQKQYSDAKVLFQRALIGWEKQLGPEHPHTLYTVHGLANVCYGQKQYSEAQTLYQQALTGWEKQLGPENAHTLVAARNLAHVRGLL